MFLLCRLLVEVVVLCVDVVLFFFVFFFKQKTAYEMRISDWSSDVCSSDLSQPLAAGDLDVIVALTPPREPSPESMRAASFVHERALPHIKHVGTFAPFHLARQARGRGFDDVLFVGSDGRVSEGTVWNVGFWAGSAVTWPDAPALRGTCERLLPAGLAGQGVPQENRGQIGRAHV